MNGSVTKYKTDGGVRWRCRWWLPKAADGSSAQRSRSGFMTRKDASVFLRKTLAAQDKGRVAVSARSVPTVAEAAAAWLEERSADVRATTLDNWRVNLTVHVVPRLGGLRLTEVKPEHVARLYRDVAAHGKAARPRKGEVCRTAGVTCKALGCSPEAHDGLAAKSVGHVHNALRGLLAQAVEDGVLISNPTDDKRARRAVPERVSDEHRVSEADYWTTEEARAFLAATTDPLAVVWSVALASGLRRAELAALVWGNVDLEAGVLKVRRSTTSVRGRAVTTEGRGRQAGKTAAADRDVPIGATTVALLRAHRVTQAAAQLAAERGEWTDTEGHVFTESGHAVHPDRLSKRWAVAVKAANVRHIGLHGSRHFAISAWLSEGLSPVLVAKYAGHSDAGVTMRVYAHVIRDDDSRAREVMEGTLYGSA